MDSAWPRNPSLSYSSFFPPSSASLPCVGDGQDGDGAVAAGVFRVVVVELAGPGRVTRNSRVASSPSRTTACSLGGDTLMVFRGLARRTDGDCCRIEAILVL